MRAKLLFLFIVIPLIELAILVRIGGWIGVWPTIGLVLLTGALGAALARSQGARVLHDIRYDLSQGRMPAARLLDGFMILVGGLLLLTPGILGDIFGLILLLPPTRAAFKRMLRRRLERMIRTGQIHYFTRIR